MSRIAELKLYDQSFGGSRSDLTAEQKALTVHPLAETVAKGILHQESQGWASIRDLSGRHPFGKVESFITELVAHKILATTKKGAWWKFTFLSHAWARTAVALAEK